MKRIIFCMLIFSSIICRAQDTHFSQISDNELLINPCFIQKIVSDYAFKVQSRSQWQSVAEPFKTFSASAYFREVRNIGSLGINFLSDNSGNASLNNNSLKFFYAKDIMFVKGLSFGTAISFNQRSINFSELNFEQYEYFSSSKKNYFDLTLGTNYSFDFNNNQSHNLGLSINHLNKPNISLVSLDDKLQLKYNFAYFYNFNLNDINYETFFFHSFQNSQNETLLGLNLQYVFRNTIKNKTIIKPLLCYRFSDAIVAGAGFRHNNYELTFSYDINVSEFSKATNYNGAIEFTLIYYLFKKQKQNKIDKCPSYI